MIRIGVALPYVSARQMAEFSQAAETAGWDGCFAGDAVWCEDPWIGLTAAAMVTERIRLGTFITPAPLRRPWKLASESVALDRLSQGRLTLGLGAGATWMGWQAFPDETTNTRSRVEMLDETIDLLTLLYQRQPFDYEGRHYHVRLTALDVQHYPPPPVQQPRIPLWVVGQWPSLKSMQRALKGDGVVVEKKAGAEPLMPAEIGEIKRFIAAQRHPAEPFEIVVSGTLAGMERRQQQHIVQSWQEAGATWFVDGLWGTEPAAALTHIRQGPPGPRGVHE